MAGSMKDIKLRIRSVQSTMQITKAMELVASSKLRHARERMEQARPYFETLQATLADIAAANTEFTSPYLARRPVKKTCYIVIAGDRGLAATTRICSSWWLRLPKAKSAVCCPWAKRRWSTSSTGA